MLFLNIIGNHSIKQVIVKKSLIAFLGILICSTSYGNMDSLAKTARTVGQDKWGIDFGLNLYDGWAVYFNQKLRESNNRNVNIFSFGPVRPRFLISRGLSDNFDLTLQVSLPLDGYNNLSAKYAFLNNSNGLSISGTAMAGVIEYLYKYYLGFIFSYKNNWFEPYFNIGYWLQFVNQTDVNLIDLDAIVSVLGFNFWVNESFFINLNIEHNFYSSWILNNDRGEVPFSARFEIIGPKLGITYRF